MTDDIRIGKLESDVHHLQADVTEIKSDVKSLPIHGRFAEIGIPVIQDRGSERIYWGGERVWIGQGVHRVPAHSHRASETVDGNYGGGHDTVRVGRRAGAGAVSETVTA